MTGNTAARRGASSLADRHNQLHGARLEPEQERAAQRTVAMAQLRGVVNRGEAIRILAMLGLDRRIDDAGADDVHDERLEPK